MQPIISAQDYLKSKIDEYKYGVISAEEFCLAMKDIGEYPIAIMDRKTKSVVNDMIPEICKSYSDAEESDPDRDLRFWIGLKDCTYLMDRGCTFTEEREEYYRTGKGRLEPVEYTDDSAIPIGRKKRKCSKSTSGLTGRVSMTAFRAC